jgi:hypothetical protein
VNRYGRARRVESTGAPDRTPHPHPDAERPTRKMPFEQLRTLVISLIQTDPDDRDEGAALEDTDPVAEFDARPTTCVPHPRVETIDQLIAALPRHEPRLGQGSSPNLPRPESRIRSGSYVLRHDTEPCPPPEPVRRGRDRTRATTGRGSQRR